MKERRRVLQAITGWHTHRHTHTHSVYRVHCVNVGEMQMRNCFFFICFVHSTCWWHFPVCLHMTEAIKLHNNNLTLAWFSMQLLPVCLELVRFERWVLDKLQVLYKQRGLPFFHCDPSWVWPLINSSQYLHHSKTDGLCSLWHLKIWVLGCLGRERQKERGGKTSVAQEQMCSLL